MKSVVSIYQENDVLTPAFSIAKQFLFQSYFDSTLLQNALLQQFVGVGIVDAELVDIKGYAIGLHPSSQTPVGVRFNASDSRTQKSPVYVLKPGQVIRPTGGSKTHAFAGFSWGLPFGWLGGGLANLVVFKTADADVLWSSNAEVIFHRSRYEVVQPGDITDAPNNWPMRFPWPLAASSASGSTPQYGQPMIAIVEPTKTLMVLRGVRELDAPAIVRMLFQATEDVGVNSAGAAVLTTPAFVDITWDAFVDLASLGGAGNLSTNDPVQVFTNEAQVRLAADQGGVQFVDMSGLSIFDGAFIDIVRYGKL